MSSLAQSKLSKTTAVGKNATSSVKVTKTLTWKERIPPQDYQLLKETFQIFDEDHSGSIDLEQIAKIFEKLGIEHYNRVVRGVLEGLRERNKPITFDDFLEIVCGQVGETKTKDGLRRVFNLFDTNEDGYVEYDEFKDVVHIAHMSMNDEDILQMFHSSFINNHTSSNMSFNFEEFYTIVTKPLH